MQKPRQIKVIIPEDLTEVANDDLSEQVKFDLHRKNQEVKEISRILHELATKEKADQRHWLQENEDLMFTLAEDYVEDSLYKLDGAEMNSETLELSVQVMSDLRKTLTLFQTVLDSHDELEA